MTMKFTNIAKGQLTQSIAKMLFEKAGYRVTRLGIEELFSEVIHLDQKQYLELELPENLRSLPDLLIATKEMTCAKLIEVKFRSSFNEASAKGLYDILSKQFKCWPNTVCMLMISKSPINGGRFHQDYIRIVDKSNLRYLDSSRWDTSAQTSKEPDLVQHMITNQFKVAGASGIWVQLKKLSDEFSLFGHKTTDTWMSADLITQTLSDLQKLEE